MEDPVAKRLRTGEHLKDDDINSPPTIPTFDMATLSVTDFLHAYHLYQAVHIKSGPNQQRSAKNITSWKDIGAIYEGLNDEDKESWCIENPGATKEEDLLSSTFLAPRITSHRAYCSFLVQETKASYSRLLRKLPLASLPCSVDITWEYEPCLWVFFGRNPDDAGPLEGRTHHTDSVSHDGTWHYQLSGNKEWSISPSCDLLNLWKKDPIQESWNEATKLKVSCHQGDVIVINTRLWFHSTVIPFQADPSVSYARDFRTTKCQSCDDDTPTPRMTNVDGLYATNQIESGTILFTEADMPDCALHRSKNNPNCRVVDLEDGTSAVVSMRDIATGEFFCLPESSDEEGEEVEEEEASDEEQE